MEMEAIPVPVDIHIQNEAAKAVTVFASTLRRVPVLLTYTISSLDAGKSERYAPGLGSLTPGGHSIPASTKPLPHGRTSIFEVLSWILN
jgi:hypothetical protein